MDAKELLELFADYADARRRLEVGENGETEGKEALEELSSRLQVILSSRSLQN